MATTSKSKKTTKTAKTATRKISIEMSQDKETKGAVRYSDGSDNFPKTIYFRKEELEDIFGEWPKSITVTIEAS